MCELGCPSLDYVYDMSMAEFYIRLYAYNRKEVKRLREFRSLLFHTIKAPHLDPKHLPKTEDAFMKLPGEAPRRASEATRKLFFKKWEAYQNLQKYGRNE